MRRKKYLLPILFFLVTVLMVFFFWHEISDLYRTRSLKNGLKDISLSSIQIDGKQYSVENGKPLGILTSSEAVKVLNFVAFYQWTKEDPLFYSPDLNIEEFSKSVEDVALDQEKLLVTIKRKRHIYPDDFLKSFVKTFKLTQEFLKTPSLENAELLIKEQRKTSYVYKSDAAGLASFIEKNNTDKKFSIVDFNIKRSISTVISDLSKLTENSSALDSEINKREGCLNGKSICQRPKDKFEKPKSNTISRNLIKESLLDKKLIFSPSSANFNYSLVRGPYRAKTPCFGWGDNFTYPEYYFYVAQGSRESNIQIATETYFRKLFVGSVATDEKALMDLGINYTPVLSSTLYMCPYNENLAEVSEMDVFFRENKPVLSYLKPFGKESTRDMFGKAKSLEDEIFKSPSPSYDDLLMLAQHYGYLYRLISEDESILGQELALKEELLRRRLVIYGKLGDFDKIINDVAARIRGATEKVEGVSTGEKKTFVDILLYPFRNFYGVVYLPFSPSVFRLDEKLAYIDKIKVTGAVYTDGPHMTLTQALKKYSMAEILRWLDVKKPMYDSLLGNKAKR